MNDDSLRVLIVADDLLARAGLAALLETHPTCDIVGQTTTGGNLSREIIVFRPDAVLVDLGWEFDVTSGRLQPLIDETDLPLVTLLADDADAQTMLAVLRNRGGFGVLGRDNEPETLVTALMTAASGLIVIDPAYAPLLAVADDITDTSPLPEPLTPREMDVLQLVARGLTNKAIAQSLGITDHTVKFHLNAIMGKLDAQSRTEAVVIATRAGLIAL